MNPPDTQVIWMGIVCAGCLLSYCWGWSAAKSETPKNKKKSKPYNPAADY